MSNHILSDKEYNNLYNFEKNTWQGPCTKHTRWCFYKKYSSSPYYGHLYNKIQFECCNKHLIYLLKKLSDASKIFNFDFFLFFGSLLGCLRNGKMVPYDADIDVGICEDQLANFNKAKKYLCSNDEVVTWSSSKIILYKLSSINSIHIDLFVYKKNKNNMITSCQHSSSPESYFLKDDLFPLKKTLFENIEVLIPNKSREYLERNYGEKCIENPITKHCYINNYVQIGSKGDLPDKNTWEKLLDNKEK